MIKNKLAVLLKQTAQVGLVFLAMLLLTGGRPSEFIIGVSVVSGIGFVAWSETRRI